MRLFIAIKVREDAQRSVKAVQDSFRRQRVRGRYTPADDLHITLAFIGEYGEPNEVLAAMSDVSFSPFEITADRVGHFETTWWAGFSDSSELDRLARKLRKSLDDAGIPYDGRKGFRAHVTFVRGKDCVEDGKSANRYIAPGRMTVERFCLFRSNPGKDGMIYTELGAVSSQHGL